MEAAVLRLSLTCLAVLLLLAGCAGQGREQRVFPPDVRLDELRLDPAQQHELIVVLRIQSFSTVASTLESLQLGLELGDGAPIALDAAPGLVVLPLSAEPLELRVPLSPAAADALRTALQDRLALRYRLHGRVQIDPPGIRHPIDYRSALSPVPGLAGVLR